MSIAIFASIFSVQYEGPTDDDWNASGSSSPIPREWLASTLDWPRFLRGIQRQVDAGTCHLCHTRGNVFVLQRRGLAQVPVSGGTSRLAQNHLRQSVVHDLL